MNTNTDKLDPLALQILPGIQGEGIVLGESTKVVDISRLTHNSIIDEKINASLTISPKPINIVSQRVSPYTSPRTSIQDIKAPTILGSLSACTIEDERSKRVPSNYFKVSSAARSTRSSLPSIRTSLLHSPAMSQPSSMSSNAVYGISSPPLSAKLCDGASSKMFNGIETSEEECINELQKIVLMLKISDDSDIADECTAQQVLHNLTMISTLCNKSYKSKELFGKRDTASLLVYILRRYLHLNIASYLHESMLQSILESICSFARNDNHNKTQLGCCGLCSDLVTIIHDQVDKIKTISQDIDLKCRHDALASNIHCLQAALLLVYNLANKISSALYTDNFQSGKSGREHHSSSKNCLNSKDVSSKKCSSIEIARSNESEKSDNLSEQTVESSTDCLLPTFATDSLPSPVDVLMVSTKHHHKNHSSLHQSSLPASPVASKRNRNDFAKSTKSAMNSPVNHNSTVFPALFNGHEASLSKLSNKLESVAHSHRVQSTNALIPNKILFSRAGGCKEIKDILEFLIALPISIEKQLFSCITHATCQVIGSLAAVASLAVALGQHDVSEMLVYFLDQSFSQYKNDMMKDDSLCNIDVLYMEQRMACICQALTPFLQSMAQIDRVISFDSYKHKPHGTNPCILLCDLIDKSWMNYVAMTENTPLSPRGSSIGKSDNSEKLRKSPRHQTSRPGSFRVPSDIANDINIPLMKYERRINLEKLLVNAFTMLVSICRQYQKLIHKTASEAKTTESEMNTVGSNAQSVALNKAVSGLYEYVYHSNHLLLLFQRISRYRPESVDHGASNRFSSLSSSKYTSKAQSSLLLSPSISEINGVIAKAKEFLGLIDSYSPHNDHKEYYELP